MPKIYKYFSNDVIELIFEKEGFCGVKCSLPKDYNDPYELFLGMDLNTPTKQLAFYNDIINKIPQSPTTCFSKSPIVSPMWAHYANNHSGFVLEFDLDGLQKHFEGNPIWDVSYRTEPDPNLKKILNRASKTLKPRHSFELQEFIFVESYFSKYDDWKYEQECRFVDMTKVTKKVSDYDILHIPTELITAIIIGPKLPPDKIQLTQEVAENNNLIWYELIVGKSHPKPYMRNETKDIFIFRENEITHSLQTCNNCSEPLIAEGSLCPWCSITEGDEEVAAIKNPFRMINKMGQLENYMKSMGKIGR